MCAPDAPPPPDVVGQAQAQGAANAEAARTQGRINNPNVYGPGFSRNVVWNGDTPTIYQNLTPEEWEIYNQNVALRQAMGGLGLQGAEGLEGIIGKPVDFSGVARAGDVYKPGQSPTALDPNALPKMPAAYQGATNLPEVSSGEDTRNRVIQAMLTRSNDEIGKREEQVKSDLIAQGIRPGTEAYAREMDTIGRQRNDAMSQAEIAGGDAAQQMFGMDAARRAQLYGEGTTDAGLKFSQGMGVRGQAAGEQAQRFNQQGQVSQLGQSQQAQQNAQQNELRRQQIAELLTRRQVPLNEIAALTGRGQVQNQFAGQQGGNNFSGVNVAPAPVFAAGNALNQYNQDVYNAEMGATNSQRSAAASALAAWGSYAAATGAFF